MLGIMAAAPPINSTHPPVAIMEPAGRADERAHAADLLSHEDIEQRRWMRRQLMRSLTHRVRATIQKAANCAFRLNERFSVVHLYASLLWDRDASRALTAMGADIKRMRVVLHDDYRRALRHAPDPIACTPYGDGTPDDNLRDVLIDFYNHALRTNRRLIHGGHLLVSLLEHARLPDMSWALIADAGISAITLKQYIAHGAHHDTWLRRLWHRLVRGPRPLLFEYRAHDKPLGPRMEVGVIPEREVHVVLHDDPYTTKDFVVDVLQAQFGLSRERADELMNRTHDAGWAYIGPLTVEVAELRIRAVHERARQSGYPLQLSMYRDPPD